MELARHELREMTCLGAVRRQGFLSASPHRKACSVSCIDRGAVSDFEREADSRLRGAKRRYFPTTFTDAKILPSAAACLSKAACGPHCASWMKRLLPIETARTLTVWGWPLSATAEYTHSVESMPAKALVSEPHKTRKSPAERGFYLEGLSTSRRLSCPS